MVAVYVAAVAGAALVIPSLPLTLKAAQQTSIEGSESARALLVSQKRFQTSQEMGMVLFTSLRLKVDDPGFRDRVKATLAKIDAAEPSAGVPLTIYDGNPLLAKFASPDRQATIAIVPLYGNAKTAPKAAKRVEATAARASTAEVRSRFISASSVMQATVEATTAETRTAVARAAPPILLLTMIAMGAIVGAVLLIYVPILSAPLTAIVVAVGALTLLGDVLVLNVFGVATVVLIGLALGIDHTIIVFSRYRDERNAGWEPEAAAARAAHTAGRAVALSVVVGFVAVAPLLLMPAVTYRSFAVSAMLVLAVLGVVSATLLPAVLGLLRGAVFAGRLPWHHPLSDPVTWRIGRFLGAVMARPRTVLLGSAVVLVLLAVPAGDLRPVTGTTSLLPPDLPVRRRAESVQAAFVPGILAPVTVIVESAQPILEDVDAYKRLVDLQRLVAADRDTYTVVGPADLVALIAAQAPSVSPEQQEQLEALKNRDLSKLTGAAGSGDQGPQATPAEQERKDMEAQLSATSQAFALLPGLGLKAQQLLRGSVAQLQVFGRPAPDTPAAEAYIRRLRRYAARVYGAGSGFREAGRASVGSLVASGMDVADATRARFPWVITLTGVSLFLVLLVTLRAPLAAALGVALELASLAAAFGVLVLVFQRGWADPLATPVGYVEAEIPMIAASVLLALSTGYLVFFLLRIREVEPSVTPRIDTLRTMAGAARVGMAGSGVMFVLFFFFSVSRGVMPQQIGVSLTAVVLIDLLVVRGLFIPAFVGRFGRRLWWLPAWADRALPGKGRARG